MSSSRCPTCSIEFDPQKSKAMPFCSDRCRKIDLGRWLKEEISMPLGEVSEGDQDPADRYGDEKED